MKKGDLVRVKASHKFGTTAYPQNLSGVWAHISPGEVSVLLYDMKAGDIEGYIDILHPKHGVCSILREVLEVV